ncbi:MAG: AmmeMemoRadiSam system protein B [Patescibacteria group bacterium]
MSLVFSAIAPHPPILIPNIGKGEAAKVKKTQEALNLLEQDLYIAKPQIILIISPHGSFFADAFSVNAHTNFCSSFEQFGDFSTKNEWKGSPDLGAKIAHKAKDEKIPVQLISEEHLDHGACVPLHFLTTHLPDIKILPIGYSALDRKKHLRFGELLKEAVMESDKRIAVIASGDLSHALKTEAPCGFHKDGGIFDKKLIELLENNNIPGIIQMNDDLVDNAKECGFRSFLLLLGIIKNMNFVFKNHSYEAPFGVGYLVGNFVF